MADLAADRSGELLAIVGCGNPTRRDDGFGAAVIRRLMHRAGPRVMIRDAGTDGMAVMFAARGCTTLIVVDACTTGSAPGTLFELPSEAVAEPAPPALTLHAFRWQHALYAGRRMYGAGFPARVIVLLAEAGSLDFGLELSAPVDAAVAATVTRIEREIANHAARAAARSDVSDAGRDLGLDGA